MYGVWAAASAAPSTTVVATRTASHSARFLRVGRLRIPPPRGVRQGQTDITRHVSLCMTPLQRPASRRVCPRLLAPIPATAPGCRLPYTGGNNPGRPGVTSPGADRLTVPRHNQPPDAAIDPAAFEQ